jgi:hypothetical protein
MIFVLVKVTNKKLVFGVNIYANIKELEMVVIKVEAMLREFFLMSFKYDENNMYRRALNGMFINFKRKKRECVQYGASSRNDLFSML